MGFATRLETLSRLIERALAIESLPGDLMLVAALKADFRLPVSVLTHHRSLYALRPTESDVIEACGQSPFLHGNLIWCPDALIVIPFYFDPTTLVISNTPECKMCDFRAFLTRLLGHDYFEVHPNHQPRSFRARFRDHATALCMWRALQFAPFRGNVMTSTILASLVPLDPPKPLSPSHAHKKRSQTGERLRGIQKRKVPSRAIVNSGSLPAVMPACMATMGELPQAVLLAAKGGTIG
jgi:hypothetical protein